MHVPAPEANGGYGSITHHVAARETERLDVRTVLSETSYGSAIKQSTRLEIDDTKTSAMGEDVTEHYTQCFTCKI